VLQNVAVTFMAKWNEKLAGSSFHFHTSLWGADGKEARFAAPSPTASSDKSPTGMSSVMRGWLAGMMEHAKAMTLFYAPFVNSYKRYQSASFAPTRIVWSRDNRTAGFRIVGEGSSLRVENRIPGADANPYLVYAAAIAAGLDGIERKLEPPDNFAGDAYKLAEVPMIPLSLPEAIASLEKSDLARRVLGDEVVEHYLHAGRTEVRKFAEVVTCWELERHFERT
jgi:glutamine synthetase